VPPIDSTKAIIRTASYVSIIAVDGERSQSRSQLLLPGQHKIRLFSEAPRLARVPKLPPGAIGVELLSVDCEIAISLKPGDHGLISRQRYRDPEQIQFQVSGSVSGEIVEGASCRSYCGMERREEGFLVHTLKLCSKLAAEGIETQPPIVRSP
jgi:hypothetical protein